MKGEYKKEIESPTTRFYYLFGLISFCRFPVHSFVRSSLFREASHSAFCMVLGDQGYPRPTRSLPSASQEGADAEHL